MCIYIYIYVYIYIYYVYIIYPAYTITITADCGIAKRPRRALWRAEFPEAEVLFSWYGYNFGRRESQQKCTCCNL